jgi:hypothetical protein
VSFEVGDRVKRASSAWLTGPEVVVPRTQPLDLAAVETMTGRPVLTFPYRFYTRALAEGAGRRVCDRPAIRPRTPDVPAVLAYDRAEADDFVNHQIHGVVAIRVADGMPPDVSAFVSAVDEACAAYTCLHIATEA